MLFKTQFETPNNSRGGSISLSANPIEASTRKVNLSSGCYPSGSPTTGCVIPSLSRVKREANRCGQVIQAVWFC
jgi:hypothetical protein